MAKISLDDLALSKISGGRTLPKDWEKIADLYAPSLLKQYKGYTYEQACAKLREYFKDEEDLALLYEYIKKYFPQENQ